MPSLKGQPAKNILARIFRVLFCMISLLSVSPQRNDWRIFHPQGIIFQGPVPRFALAVSFLHLTHSGLPSQVRETQKNNFIVKRFKTFFWLWSPNESQGSFLPVPFIAAKGYWLMHFCMCIIKTLYLWNGVPSCSEDMRCHKASYCL